MRQRSGGVLSRINLLTSGLQEYKKMLKSGFKFLKGRFKFFSFWF